MKNFVEYTLLDAITPQSVTSSTDATPIVVTKNSHGYATGDLITINGHTTNIAANGTFKITYLTANTFSLQNKDTGADIAGSGAGAGANGVMAKAAKIALVSDFHSAILFVTTASTATLTYKVCGSLGKLAADVTPPASDTPNFGATISKSNPYSFLQVVNLATGTAVDGGTGIAAAGTDLANMYEVNTNGFKYLTLIPTAFTQGSITVKLQLLDNQ